MAEWLDKILAKEEIYNPIINKSHCDIIQGKRKKNQYGQQYKIFYKKTVKHFSLSNPADRHSFPERYDILSGKFLENYFFILKKSKNRIIRINTGILSNMKQKIKEFYH